MSVIKVLTYNIHKGFSPGRLRFQLPKMRDALQSVNADLVFLQEVLGESQRESKRRKEWPDATQIEYIAQEIWPHAIYGKNVIYDTGHHGSAILSKYPILTWQNINIAKMRFASRSILHAEVAVNDTRLHCLCVHMGLLKQERREQLQQLQELLCEIVAAEEPIVIAGDFNDWRKHATLYLEQLGFVEAFKATTGDYAKTFPALRPTLRADRIYYRNLELINTVNYTHRQWRVLSDHLPIAASFAI